MSAQFDHASPVQAIPVADQPGTVPSTTAAVSNDASTVQLQRYQPLIGAVVSGIDLSRPIADGDRQRLAQALVEHGVLFFRQQTLTPAQHLALARVFGEPIRKNVYIPSVDGFPDIEVIAHGEHSTSGSTDNWHVDVSWQVNPPKATVLQIQEVPAGGGGDTVWSSSAAAYDLLDPDLARYLEKLTALNTFLAAPKKPHLSDFLSGYERDDGRQETAAEGLERIRDASLRFPPIEVPVIKRHPESGRKVIFVNEAHTSHLLGVSKVASQHLLGLLYDLIKTPEVQARWAWQPGDIAIWDNRQVQHYAARDYGQARRRIHRVTLAHDGAF